MSETTDDGQDGASRESRVLEIFALVCDLQDQERNAALDAACGGDSTLRERVESLLRHDNTRDA
ncbi:MAG TPA: hypothetical protein VK157_00770, partial [Phycisphaerales bacterium]|nr:hypothetical protein [Phycisphaerales bacterium]